MTPIRCSRERLVSAFFWPRVALACRTCVIHKHSFHPPPAVILRELDTTSNIVEVEPHAIFSHGHGSACRAVQGADGNVAVPRRRSLDAMGLPMSGPCGRGVALKDLRMHATIAVPIGSRNAPYEDVGEDWPFWLLRSLVHSSKILTRRANLAQTSDPLAGHSMSHTLDRWNAVSPSLRETVARLICALTSTPKPAADR